MYTSRHVTSLTICCNSASTKVVPNYSVGMNDKLIIGGFVLVVLVGVILSRLVTMDRDRRGLSAILVKLYGLLSVSGFALLLAISTAETNVKTAGFTLLGTVAGFLAGKDVPDELAKNAKGDAAAE
jgi:predicted CDP-diglyceride synthetase/phosphatidate cytidylyltransferase